MLFIELLQLDFQLIFKNMKTNQIERLTKKVRTTGTILLILTILSLTWFFIDYLALKKIWLTANSGDGFEWLMVILSAVPFGLMIIFSFAFVFFVFRLSRKIKAETNKLEKETGEESKDKD